MWQSAFASSTLELRGRWGSLCQLQGQTEKISELGFIKLQQTTVNLSLLAITNDTKMC
ncbi:MAG: hypothetical protein Q7S87_14165 [Agitococcus sp.]|nr:hypothetical protein [Agitococcus sp.]